MNHAAFTSATQLQALVPASLVSEEGTATVAVMEDSGTSGDLPFTITDAALSNLLLNDPGGEIEGKGTGTFTIGTFQDATEPSMEKDSLGGRVAGAEPERSPGGRTGASLRLSPGHAPCRSCH